MTALIRYAALMVPLLTLAVAMAAGPRLDRRTKGALLLSFAAAATGIGALNVFATELGWWSFAPVDGSFLGVPLDVWLGWAIVWGPLPVLLPARLPILLLGLGWLDLVAMPRLAPVLELGEGWLVGEVAGLAGVALPALLLGRWTIERTRLRARATLQLMTFTGLVGWLLPTAVFSRADGGWHHLWTGPAWWTAIVVQLLSLAAVPGLSGLTEFVARGNGTPYPWDPPDRLVTTGLYAYLANPMQLSATVLLGVLALGTHSWGLAATAVSALAFSVALAEPHERDDLDSRLGVGWRHYAARVRPWLVRRSPYVPAPARLYLAHGCTICDQLRDWLAHRSPVGLEVLAAEGYPAGSLAALRRARYVGADGHQADGLAAFARALEHCGPVWAYVGAAIRLPVVRPVLQLVIDAMGAGPRDLDPARGRTDERERHPHGPDGCRTAHRR